jgi:hypothetical protein
MYYANFSKFSTDIITCNLQIHDNLLPYRIPVVLGCHRVLSYLWMAEQCLHGVCDEQDVPRTRDHDHKSIHYLQQDTRVIMQHSACVWQMGWEKGLASFSAGVTVNTPWHVELESALHNYHKPVHLDLYSD